MPYVDGGIPAGLFFILIIPSAALIGIVENPLNGLLGDFLEVRDVVSEGVAEDVALAKRVGRNGVLVAPVAFEVRCEFSLIFKP